MNHAGGGSTSSSSRTSTSSTSPSSQLMLFLGLISSSRLVELQRRSKVSLIVCLCVCVANRIEMSGELDTYTSYPCHSRRQSFATMAVKRKKTTVFIPCHYGGEEKGDTVSSTRLKRNLNHSRRQSPPHRLRASLQAPPPECGYLPSHPMSAACSCTKSSHSLKLRSVMDDRLSLSVF